MSPLLRNECTKLNWRLWPLRWNFISGPTTPCLPGIFLLRTILKSEQKGAVCHAVLLEFAKGMLGAVGNNDGSVTTAELFCCGMSVGEGGRISGSGNL